MNAQNLEEYKWKNRILIIETESESSARYQLQGDEFDYSDEAFRERKLMLIRIVGEKYVVNDFQENSEKSEWKIVEKNHDSFLNKKDTFRIILIGLDGNIKLSKTDILRKKELFDLIDSMPMRKAELDQKEN